MLSLVDPTERRLLCWSCLRKHPLSPRQIQRVMGLDRQIQEQMEREGIGRLRVVRVSPIQ